MTKRAALLARVSTPAQARDDKFGISTQLEQGRLYAKRMGFLVGGEFVDQISGASETREALFRLIGEADRYEVAVVYDTARVGRDEEYSHRFLRLLREAGLEVHSATRGGVVEAGFVTSAEIMMAAEVRRTILRNTLNARVAKAEAGGLPSGIKLYGYRSVRGVAAEHPEHGPHLKRLFALAADTSFFDISDRYNAEGVPLRVPYRKERYVDADGNAAVRTVATRWHHSTVSQIVRNPAYYTGVLPWGRFRLPIPPLVSEEAWRKAQRRRGPPARLDWPLRGHLRCGACGSRMSGWRCSNRYRCQRRGCSFGLPRALAEGRVAVAVADLLADRAELSRILTPHAPPGDAALELQRLEQASAEAFAAWRRGIITADELGAVRRDLEAERRGVLAALAPPPPDDLALDEAAMMTPWEAMAGLSLVATVTKNGVLLRVE